MLGGHGDSIALGYQRIREIHAHIMSVGVSKKELMSAYREGRQDSFRLKPDDALATADGIDVWKAGGERLHLKRPPIDFELNRAQHPRGIRLLFLRRQ